MAGARGKELRNCMGFRRQTGTGVDAQTAAQLQTSLIAADMWSLLDGSFSPALPKFADESDAQFYGKGHEFPTQVFQTSQSIVKSMSSHMTSQNFAHGAAFAMGNVVETNPGAGAYQYVCTGLDRIVSGSNLPATTFASQVRGQTAGEILDVSAPGFVLNSFSLNAQRGPGLKNTTVKSDWKGCGKFTNNAGLVMPAAYAETRLGAGGATAVTWNSVNFLTDARFYNLDFQINNNVPDGFYPGSGSQAGRDVMGELIAGDRTATLTWTIRAKVGWQELVDFLAGTEGALQIKFVGSLIVGAIYHTAQIDAPRTRHIAFDPVETEGFVTANITTEILYPSSGERLTLTAITDKAGICAVP